MTCQEVAHSEIVERYIAGSLPPEQAGQFEEHFFACAACLARLEAAQSLAADWPALVHAVPRAAPRATPRWMPWPLLPPASSSPPPPRSSGDLPPPPGARGPNTHPRQPAAPAAVAYAALGRFEPPPYRQVALRGAGDKADDTFRRAMRAYQDRRFTDALPLLAHRRRATFSQRRPISLSPTIARRRPRRRTRRRPEFSAAPRR